MAPTKKGTRKNRQQQIAVYVEPVLCRPSCCIPLDVQLRGKGVQTMKLPAFLNTSAWRVTSCDLSIASETISHCVVRLYVADIGGAAGLNSLISMESREFVVSSSVQQLKLRNGSRTQHGVSGAGAPVLSVTFSEQAQGTCVGVCFVSVIGAL